jgi:hypothetical protein
MLAKVDLGETALPQETDKAIVAKLLFYAGGHLGTSSRETRTRFIRYLP